MTTSTVPDEAAIPETSQASGVPKRTIYRWIASGKLKSRTTDGVQVVSLDAVRALAAARDVGGPPGSAVPRAGAGAGTGTQPASPVVPPPQVDGVVAARVFAAFAAGEGPTEVVQEMELPPRTVLELWRQHGELRDAGSPGRPSLAEKLADLERRLTLHVGEFEQLTLGASLGVEVQSLRADVEALRASIELVRTELAQIPVPRSGKFTCQCGARGWVQSLVHCSACGAQVWWGWNPDRQ